MDVDIDITRAKIETDRLILRAWLTTDLNDFYEYASVEGVGEMAGWKHHETIDVSKNVLQSFISAKNEFAVVHKENNKVIGSLGLHNSWANDEPEYKSLKLKEIGYVLSKDYWGQGLIPEAVRAVSIFCFDECRLDAITSGHSLTNKQSKRVLEKCGFKCVSTRESYFQQFQLFCYGMKYILLNPR